MPEQDLVSLILNLSAHENKQGQILRKDKDIEDAISKLVANAERAVPLLIEAFDYGTFYRKHGGPRWHVPYDICRLRTSLLGIENVRKTLMEIGDKAKSDLIKHLEDKNYTIMHNSLQCLLTMGEATSILQDKIIDGSLAHPKLIPAFSYILKCRHSNRDGNVYTYNEELRQMAYDAILTITEKYPKKSLPQLKTYYYSIIHGIDNPVEMLERAKDIFTKDELLMLKVSRCKQEERKAAAMEIAKTGTEEAIKALIHMANGTRLYSPRRGWHIYRKTHRSYKLADQLDVIDALAETGSKKALKYLEKLAWHQKTEQREKHHYWDGSLAWDGLVGSIVFPFAKGDLRKHLDRKSITLEVYEGRQSPLEPEKRNPNWADKILARNNTYQGILSSIERLRKVISN